MLPPFLRNSILFFSLLSYVIRSFLLSLGYSKYIGTQYEIILFHANYQGKRTRAFKFQRILRKFAMKVN